MSDEKSSLESLKRGWVNNNKVNLSEYGVKVWLRLNWLRVGSIGGLMWTRCCTFAFTISRER
jgi:hypothetical protein